MKIQCEYCSIHYDDELEKCPNCGSPNKFIRRGSNDVPKTIEELIEYCNNKNIPYENLRFYIGKDYKGAKAFGIYKDEATGNFVVYKNKSNGSRAIRYEGKDEAYAVNEIYLKLREIVTQVKNENRNKNRKKLSQSDWNKHNKVLDIISNFIEKVFGVYAIVMCIMAFASIVISCSESLYYNKLDGSKGYYKYEDDTYYHYKDKWYRWDSIDRYWDYESSVEFEDSYEDYFYSDEYGDGYHGYNDFEESDHYYSFWDDSDSDYDSDDWDSDWDSDWDYDYDYDWDSDW